MLGYFFDPASAPLLAFLEGQRALRVSRVREIGARLAALGMPVDVEALVADGRDAVRHARSAARRLRARWSRPATSLGAGGVRSLSGHGPAGLCAAHRPSPADVVDVIHAAGGIASLAHPGVTKRDELIRPAGRSRPRCHRGLSLRSSGRGRAGVPRPGAAPGPAGQRRLRFSRRLDSSGLAAPVAQGRASSRTDRNSLGVVLLPPDAFAALERTRRKRRRPS